MLAAFAGCIWLCPDKARAGPVISCASSGYLFNTAYQLDTLSQPVGSRDINWESGFGTPGGTPASVSSWTPAYVIGQLASPWAVSPFSNADWIATTADAASPNNPTAAFFRYRFELDPSIAPHDFRLKLDFFADNSVNAVFVNGVRQSVASIPQSASDPDHYVGYQQSQAASTTIVSGWVSGANELVLEARSHQQGAGSSGFLAQARTNSVCAQPAVRVSAVSTGAAGTFSYSGDNGFADQTVTTPSAGTVASAAQQALAGIGVPTTLRQAAAPGFALTGIACSGLGAGSASPTILGAAGGSVLLDAGATAGNRQVACTFSSTAMPTLSKSFQPDDFRSGEHTRLEFRISNPPGTLDTTVSFTDTLPSGLVVAATRDDGGDCANARDAGVLTAASGSNRIVVNGVKVRAGSSCTVYLNVSNAAGASNPSCAAKPAAFSNGASNLGDLVGVVSGLPSAVCVTVLPAAPTVAMVFTPGSIGPYGDSDTELKITLANPNIDMDITGAGFTNNYPGDLINTATPSAATTCTGAAVKAGANAGDTWVRLENATIPANGSCTVTVRVSARNLQNTTTYTNILGANSVNSSNAPGNTAAASATLDVRPQAFTLPAPQPISCGSSSFLFNTAYDSDTSSRPAGSLDRQWLVGAGDASGPASVTNWVPAYVVNPSAGYWVNSPFASANWISAKPDSSKISDNTYYRYDFSLASNIDVGSFTLGLDFYADDRAQAAYVNGVDQHAPSLPQSGFGAPAGAQASTILSAGWQAGVNSLVLHTIDTGGITGFLAHARASILCAKPSVTVETVSNGGTAAFAYSGDNGVAAHTVTTTVAATPALGARQTLDNFRVATTITQAGRPGFSLTAINCRNLGTGGTATVDLVAGSVLLSADAITNNRDIFCTFTNTGPPTLAKAFDPATFSSGTSTSVVFTLNNPGTTPAAGIGFTDTLPSSLQVAQVPAIGGTCPNATAAGVVAAAPGTNAIVVSGLSLAAAASCTVTVAVTNVAGATNGDCASNPAAFVNGPANISGLAGVDSGVATGACVVVPPANASHSGLRIVRDRQAADGKASDQIEVLVRDAAGAGVGGQTVEFAATPGVDLGAGPGLAARCVSAASGLCSVDVTSVAAGSYSTAATLGGTALTGAFAADGKNYTASPAAYSFLVLAPSVSMGFLPSAIAPDGTATLAITLHNQSTATAIVGAGFNDSHPAGLANAANPAAATDCPDGSASASGAGSVSLAGATVRPGGSCQLTVRVTAAALGSYTASLPAGSVTASNALASAATASATLPVRALALLRLQKVSLGAAGGSFSYSQSNLASTPASIAVLSAGVPTPGAPPAVPVLAVYTEVILTEAPVGGFDLNDAGCTDSQAAITGNTGTFGVLAGRVLTLPAARVVPGADILCVFTSGFHPGLGGRVFTDDGAGGGTANDGILDGGEAGRPGVAVALTDCGAVRHAATVSDGAGRYTLDVPLSLPVGASLCVDLEKTNARYSTGASVAATALPSGSTVGVGGVDYRYDRGLAIDRVAFAWPGPAGNVSTALNFASVPIGSLVLDGLKTGRPDTAVLYPHVFTAGTAGSLSFGVASSVATPAVPGWTERVLADPGCTGSPLPGAAQLFPPAQPQAVTAGQILCFVLEQRIPAQAPTGSKNVAQLQAELVFSNASPALTASYRLEDVTTVSAEALLLLKEVRNVSQGVASFGTSNQARPGETLEYRISYSNTAAGPITDLRINDTTPAFTSFVSATAGSTPASLTHCEKTTPAQGGGVDCAMAQTPGGAGALEWLFTGPLLPGAAGTVFFRAVVD